MALPLFLSAIVCILSSRLANGFQIGALVTIQQEEVSSVFLEEEVYGVQNRTKMNNIITIQAVIDKNRLIDIKHNKKVLSFEINIPDYDAIIHKEFARLNNRTRFTAEHGTEFWFFNEFREWVEYEIYLNALVLQYDIASKSVLGQTIQGRDIPIITLKTDTELDPTKPGFYIQASVHSNEWLANSATTWILKTLCEEYEKGNENITSVLEQMNIFIAPTVNIDGYIYTWIDPTTRGWRKNRRNNGNNVFGVDLNRNYDYEWGRVPGASLDPESNTYCGPEPFSEPESSAAAAFIMNDAYNIKAAIDMHTTGPYILWPWGWTTDTVDPPYYEEYFLLGASMQSEAAINGEQYESIQSATWYLTSGVFHDYVWGASDGGILSFTYEGRPIGSGDNPPIEAAGQEQMAGLLWLANFLL